MGGNGAITATGANNHATGAVLLTGDTTISVATASDALSLDGSISGSQALTKVGSGALILSGTNSYTTTTISNGYLQVGNNSTTGTLGSGAVTDNASLVFARSNNYTPGNVINGTGSVTQDGSATLVLSTANSYQGATSVNSGVLALTDANALGNSSGTTVANSGAGF